MTTAAVEQPKEETPLEKKEEPVEKRDAESDDEDSDDEAEEVDPATAAQQSQVCICKQFY